MWYMTNSMFLGTDLNASIYAQPEELMSQSFNSTATSASRRRFGRRRMGRSNSDACFLSVSAIPLFQSTPNSRGSHRLVSGGDSDTTSSAAYEQSDAPAYEWDDYKPEAKDESTISVGDFLTAVHSTPKMNDDDYGLQLNGSEPDVVDVQRAQDMLTESKNNLNNALKMLSDPENDLNSRSAVKVCALSNIHRLTAIVNAQPRMKQEVNDEISKVEEEWKTVLHSLEDPQPSPRPPSDPRQSTPELKLDLSAYQKLADTLRNSFLDESYIDSFKTIDDVDNMIRVYRKIHDRLQEERNSFEDETDGLQELLKECDMCLANIAETTNQLEKLKENWIQWTKLGSSVESTMQDLENRLNNFGNTTTSPEMICEELEECQDRMGRLETVCNFLTAHLNELSARPCSGYDHTDFAAEFKKYSVELEKLQIRYEKLRAQDSLNSTTSTVSVGTSTSPRKRRQTKAKSPSPVKRVVTRTTIAHRVVSAVRCSIPIQILLGLTLLVALGTFLYSYADERPVNRWRNSFGPHLDYVRGPPPV
uniref:KASH domain-containing protein n=2 Tax=Steinernema glaseri TaxID=37863 RepID=A0A1I8ATY9_9BILA